jgi:hypothetical protein
MTRKSWIGRQRAQSDCVSQISVLLNVSEEATTKDLWEKLGKLYQSKSLVNKLFLRKKMYKLEDERWRLGGRAFE